jgi:hypothetical protein
VRKGVIDGSIVGVEVGVGLEVGDGLGVGVDVWARARRGARIAIKRHGIRTNRNLILWFIDI